MSVAVLRMEWPPWKSFVAELDLVESRLDKAVHEAESAAALERLEHAENAALAALRSRNEKRQTNRPEPGHTSKPQKANHAIGNNRRALDSAPDS